MKSVITAFVLLSSTMSFASFAAERVAPSADTKVLSKIEQVITLKENKALRAQLVRVTNGGSSDISSLMSPSSLYLTVFQKGEMYDLSASYLINSSVDKIVSMKFDGARYTLKLVTTSKDDHLKVITRTSEIDFSEVIKEMTTSQCSDDSADCPLISTIKIERD